jgi:hypothetical protein
MRLFEGVPGGQSKARTARQTVVERGSILIPNDYL